MIKHAPDMLITGYHRQSEETQRKLNGCLHTIMNMCSCANDQHASGVSVSSSGMAHSTERGSSDTAVGNMLSEIFEDHHLICLIFHFCTNVGTLGIVGVNADYLLHSYFTHHHSLNCKLQTSNTNAIIQNPSEHGMSITLIDSIPTGSSARF